MLNVTPPIQSLIDPALINSVIGDYAMTVRWYPARKCDCWSKIQGVVVSSGSPDPSCPDCGGYGRTYSTYQSVNNVVLDDMHNVAIWNDQSGVNYDGQIRMYVPYTAGDIYLQAALNDLIWAQDVSLTTRSTVIRGVDVLRETPVTGVSLTWGSVNYTYGVDYRFSGKSIQWITSGPPVNERYEATYQFHPWFSIVQGMAVVQNFSHLNLPRTFVLAMNPELGETYGGI